MKISGHCDWKRPPFFRLPGRIVENCAENGGNLLLFLPICHNFPALSAIWIAILQFWYFTFKQFLSSINFNRFGFGSKRSSAVNRTSQNNNETSKIFLVFKSWLLQFKLQWITLTCVRTSAACNDTWGAEFCSRYLDWCQYYKNYCSKSCSEKHGTPC